jgi:hypothetical protein
MEILGHSSISLTITTYSHVIPVMLEDVAAKMDGILTKPAQPIERARRKDGFRRRGYLGWLPPLFLGLFSDLPNSSE